MAKCYTNGGYITSPMVDKLHDKLDHNVSRLLNLYPQITTIYIHNVSHRNRCIADVAHAQNPTLTEHGDVTTEWRYHDLLLAERVVDPSQGLLHNNLQAVLVVGFAFPVGNLWEDECRT